MPRLAPDTFLAALGYTVLHDGARPWHECLLVREGELWQGRGLTADAALENALRQAFPSHAARHLLDAALLALAAQPPAMPTPADARTPKREAPDAPPPPEPSQPTPVVTTPALATLSPAALPPARSPESEPTEAPPAIAAAQLEPATSATTNLNERRLALVPSLDAAADLQLPRGDTADLAPVPAAEPVANATKAVCEPATPDANPASAPAPIAAPANARPAAAASAATANTVDDEDVDWLADPASVAAAVTGLAARIDAERAALAVMPFYRQRLVILSWHALLRIAQDGENEAVPPMVITDTVKRIRDLLATWWPGIVSVLKKDAGPWDAHSDLKEFLPNAHPRTWEEVVLDAEQALMVAEEQDWARGRDADGWADAKALFPPPPDPALVLDEVVDELEAHGGPLGPRQPTDAEAAPPSPEALLDWAQRLRWVRGLVDRELWAAAMGRVRYHAIRPNTPEYIEVRKAIDPGKTPGRSWRQVIQARAPKSGPDIDEVLAATPRLEALANGEKPLRRWLKKALPLVAEHLEEIAEAAGPLRERIAGFDVETLVDCNRRTRHHFKRLRQALGLEAGPEQVELDSAEEPAQVAGRMREPTAEEALSRTRGKKVLVVSNRSDELLRASLKDRFECHEVGWVVCTNGRIRSACDTIARGGWEMVLGLTGFMAHSSDWMLSRACAASAVEYVRVRKGRPGAVEATLAAGRG